MDRITIIGLGYIGSSLGMALKSVHGNKMRWSDTTANGRSTTRPQK